jgi:serine/threonine kinase PknH
MLQDCLGHGSHTAVYRAWTASGEWSAVKLVDERLHGGEDLADRLQHDATVLDRLGHPHILPILNATSSDGMTAAAVPLVAGPSLQDVMQGGRLDSELAWSVITQVADSLESAHRSGLTYRVLKPTNILVRDGRAYLSEFGITGRSTGRIGLADAGCHMTAAQYLAPEQIMGEEADQRADIYAFAVLVFELATATALYEGQDASTILRHTLRDPPPSAHARNPGVPPDVDSVLRRALARDPTMRHGSIGELVEDLACPPQTGAVPAVGPDGAPAAATIDSLIDVLSQVLAAEKPDREVSPE